MNLSVTSHSDNLQQLERAAYCDLNQIVTLLPCAALLRDPAATCNEMGAQFRDVTIDGALVSGVRFLVYAPHASSVAVIGDFNGWHAKECQLTRLQQPNIDSGLWGIFIPNLKAGERYKYQLSDQCGNQLPDKTDPWGYYAEQYPSFCSLTYQQSCYQWQDEKWQTRPVTAKHQQPLSFYELHIGSWRRHENGDFYTYRELAETLIPYITEMGYTHLELMPVSEHPFYGSWGYQPIGLFAPTSRFGSPDDFKYFIDQCHQAGLGVVLDWVPAHFPADEHGLANFDGTALYNDPDPRRGWHQDWKSYIYDYGRDHVRQFLVSNALFWFEHFHIDGLRVDAVASMLYLDYSRNDGEWIPNADGGNYNYDAISLLRWINEKIYAHYPNAMMIAEESTAFPGVSKPTNLGGLGFGFKWNMGWMHDSLAYIKEESIYRCYHHNTITMPLLYSFSENYILSLSHDEVVYGKGSLMNKMPGDEWQQTANLRAYLGYMYGQPGKKLNFMGTEIGQTAEWNHDDQLQWFLLQFARHQGMKQLVKDLNHMYCSYPALYQLDCDPSGFEWRIGDAADDSLLVHERFDIVGNKVLVASNFTPVPREQYRIGVPLEGTYELILNTDDALYCGSDYSLITTIKTEAKGSHGLSDSISMVIPPLATVFYRFIPNPA